MEERRKFPRLSYPCKLIFSSAQSKEAYVGHTENISAAGLRVILQENLAINAPVGVELLVGKKKIKAEGRVVWVLDIKSVGTDEPVLFDTGIEFTRIAVEDKQFLARVVEDFLKQSQTG